MNILPPDFQFTQANLQDYTDCARRFQLRYLEKLAWPAVESEPYLENERRLALGSAFHRLAQQHLSGVPASRLSDMLGGSRFAGSELERWWGNYLEHATTVTGASDPEARPPDVLVETTLTAPIGDHRLIAKYDAIILPAVPEGTAEPGGITIVDWKTAIRRPPRQWTEGRLQTRVYPYLLARCSMAPDRAGFAENWPSSPEQIEMVYWFPEFPLQPERFHYSTERFEQDQAYLEGLAAEIGGLGSGDYHLTSHEERCAFCTYRSLCDRGVRAGTLEALYFGEESEEDSGFILDFDQIAEVEF